jgi:hypothetical protein
VVKKPRKTILQNNITKISITLPARKTMYPYMNKFFKEKMPLQKILPFQ